MVAGTAVELLIVLAYTFPMPPAGHVPLLLPTNAAVLLNAGNESEVHNRAIQERGVEPVNAVETFPPFRPSSFFTVAVMTMMTS